MNKYNLQKSTISIFDKGIAFINAFSEHELCDKASYKVQIGTQSVCILGYTGTRNHFGGRAA
jgi:hypothetical protein